MDEIAPTATGVWDSHSGEVRRRQAAGEDRRTREPRRPRRRRAASAQVPERVAPQLATLIEGAPEGDEWLHEIKYDGYRLLCRIERGEARLITRNGLDWTGFPALARRSPRCRSTSALLDGEVVALTPTAPPASTTCRTRIEARQHGATWSSSPSTCCTSTATTWRRPLAERKAASGEIVPPAAGRHGALQRPRRGAARSSSSRPASIGSKASCRSARDTPYRSGRGGDWLKIKCTSAQEFVIGGFTDPSGRGTASARCCSAITTRAATALRRPGRHRLQRRAPSANLHARLLELERKTRRRQTAERRVGEGRALGRAASSSPRWNSPTGRDGILRHPSLSGAARGQGPRGDLRPP